MICVLPKVREIWNGAKRCRVKAGQARTPTPFRPILLGWRVSGGGIRAASAGLGLLQRFHKLGLLKFTDYLSTVSGGGYIGAAYRASVALAKKPPAKNRFPLDSDPTIPDIPEERSNQAKTTDADGNEDVDTQITTSGQRASIIRLIYNGKYLFRPWEAINKYLIGVFFNNLLLFSGLVAVCQGSCCSGEHRPPVGSRFPFAVVARQRYLCGLFPVRPVDRLLACGLDALVLEVPG